MTPLRIRARLRSALTILAGEPPDHMDERIRAENAARTNLSLLEQVREQLATAEQDRDYLRERVNDLNEMLEDKDDAATTAFNAIAAACGCAHWYYPGQVVRDVRAVIKERDEAVALISTLRAEFEAYKSDAASEAKEADRLRARLAAPLPDEVEAALREVRREWPCAHESWEECSGEWRECADCGVTFRPDSSLRAKEASDRYGVAIDTLRRAVRANLPESPTPKRKRTKEERWERERKTLARMWVQPFSYAADVRAALVRLNRPATSREIAEDIEASYARGGFPPDEGRESAMRLVSDLARAGYLTVAKGPGGVRVYGLKETPE